MNLYLYSIVVLLNRPQILFQHKPIYAQSLKLNLIAAFNQMLLENHIYHGCIMYYNEFVKKILSLFQMFYRLCEQQCMEQPVLEKPD